jgi:hypothetical protein
MDARLVELYVERGRLRERISMQRGQLARELAPVGEALHTVDRARAALHRAGLWMAAHPGVVIATGVAVVVWKPRAVLRTARWGFSMWRNWAQWREWVRAGLKAF